ncbi:ferritin-like domain-containing protein [Denitrobaculum tricleocarpae]|uniref:Ferritin-like domain-containing protein n=1 Tax=Denitrobaculum tricleocarpae TaxID=2591009 RepID=A0A545TAS6_9PROT|nr:ferritin-like domain-containing protein [Denitrobaculum tricleocarpae]TQV74315.1 ferritin-like domain-containing protein [Denitrobaculum tricleocarpae]
MEQDSLSAAAVVILTTADPAEKVRLSRTIAARWRSGELRAIGNTVPPTRPQRPDHPLLMAPRDVPKRKINQGSKGRIALLHALAHIELNAIDLAWDIIARFTGDDLPKAFYDGWVQVGDEEAKHFDLLAGRLSELGASYGDLPAHDGLWRAAEETAHDLLARLAIVPMVLEARGLDVTPAMIAKLDAVGDRDSAAILQIIFDEEVGHVACGKQWFDFLCARQERSPQETWRDLVRRHFHGALKPPFNEPARSAAGLPADFYSAL